MNTTQATAGLVYEGPLSMDCASRSEVALRSDGQWFRRSQYRDARYGFKMTGWRACVAPERVSEPYGGAYKRARLPK